MTTSTTSALKPAQRPGNRPIRGRGKPQMITERATTAVARLIEGQTFAAEVSAAADLIAGAAAYGSRQMIANEAGRLGHRAQAYRAELHRLAGEIER